MFTVVVLVQVRVLVQQLLRQHVVRHQRELEIVLCWGVSALHLLPAPSLKHLLSEIITGRHYSSVSHSSVYTKVFLSISIISCHRVNGCIGPGSKSVS